MAVAGGRLGERHAGTQARPHREVAQRVGGDPAEAGLGAGVAERSGDVAGFKRSSSAVADDEVGVSVGVGGRLVDPGLQVGDERRRDRNRSAPRLWGGVPGVAFVGPALLVAGAAQGACHDAGSPAAVAREVQVVLL